MTKISSEISLAQQSYPHVGVNLNIKSGIHSVFRFVTIKVVSCHLSNGITVMYGTYFGATSGPQASPSWDRKHEPRLFCLERDISKQTKKRPLPPAEGIVLKNGPSASGGSE